MTWAYFTATENGLQPVPEGRSSWAANMLHGRLLAGLAARRAALGRSAATATIHNDD
jgi:hypothetical protein